MARVGRIDHRVLGRGAAFAVGVGAAALVAVGLAAATPSVERHATTTRAAAAPDGSRLVSTQPPVVIGAPMVGSTLRTTPGRWTGAAPLSFTFRWLRCNARGLGCALIEGATRRSYVVTRRDVGRALRSAVTAAHRKRTASARSAATETAVTPGSRIRGIAIDRLGAQWRSGSGYERYAYLVVGRGRARDAALHPGYSLVYHSGTSVNTEWDSGVPYSVARANGWLLRDAAGALLINEQYPANYIGDVGNDAYRAEFLRRVRDYAVSVGVDGIYIDDVVADISTLAGRYPAKYPNQESWENAMAGFVHVVGTALKARGLYVLVNAHKWVAGDDGSDDGTVEAQWWQRIGRSVSGLQSEYWLQDPTNPARSRSVGSEWWQNWDGWQRLVAVAQAMGADFFGYTYGPPGDTRTMRFVKGSFLLDWDGQGGALLYRLTETGDPWNPAWTTDLGRPAGAKAALASGVWTRGYARGRVVVNATTTAVTVTVDGVARTIPATDALILTR